MLEQGLLIRKLPLATWLGLPGSRGLFRLTAGSTRPCKAGELPPLPLRPHPLVRPEPIPVR